MKRAYNKSMKVKKTTKPKKKIGFTAFSTEYRYNVDITAVDDPPAIISITSNVLYVVLVLSF